MSVPASADNSLGDSTPHNYSTRPMPLDTLRRIRAEFLEMPGMRLSLEQTRRLFGVDRTICKTALEALVLENFLSVAPDGTYKRSRSEQ